MNWLAKLLFYLLSIVLHPLLLIVVLWLVFYSFNPYAFGFNDWKAQTFKATTFRLFIGTTFLPGLAFILVRKLGLIENLRMNGTKERIVPLTIACLFYFWIYLNVSENSIFPNYFQQVLLGVCLTLLLSFLFAIFTRVNLFAASSISLVLAFIISELGAHRHYFFLDGRVLLESQWLIWGMVCLMGLYLSLRLYLGRSSLQETTAGIATGLGGQLIAAIIM